MSFFSYDTDKLYQTCLKLLTQTRPPSRNRFNTKWFKGSRQPLGTLKISFLLFFSAYSFSRASSSSGCVHPLFLLLLPKKKVVRFKPSSILVLKGIFDSYYLASSLCYGCSSYCYLVVRSRKLNRTTDVHIALGGRGVLGCCCCCRFPRRPEGVVCGLFWG